ncbi:DUF4168 domain-containing protein [Coleofasciculus sp.]|uniref:DUF4168 domain-containing protein n=1 Tax=Coleofasciculus sp. TaxID=3100458 RepID=UPI003A3D4563
MLKQLLTGGSVLALVLAASLPIQAQAETPAQQPGSPSQMQETPQLEVSQEDLQKFASALEQLQSIEQETQVELVEAIENQGLSVERFQEIALAQQNPEIQPSTEISQAEVESFDQAAGQVTQIQQQAQTRMQEAVEREGLDAQQFSQIGAALQQDPTLQQQFQEMLQN